MQKFEHPNEPGKWTRLDAAEGRVLWRRDRSDPYPVTQFYLISPPMQAVVLYDEMKARAQFTALSGQVPSDPGSASI